jgi:lipid II:glycine glycyltransferase (peptidoglycan interpeptide bridge formation enzyme)
MIVLHAKKGFPSKNIKNKRVHISENLWQSDAWEKFQNSIHNSAFWRQKGEAKALVVERKPHVLKFWKSPYWEIPRGPIGKKEDFSDLLESIFDEAKKKSIAFVRVFPPECDSFWEKIKSINSWKQKAAPEIFPENSLMLNLSLSEEEMLSQMKPKGRYNIRLAEKKGVEVCAESSVDHFWQILKTTAKRDGFRTHKKYVYEKMLETFGDNALLLSAKDEGGEILGAALFVFFGSTAVYYYGASKDKKRSLMAPYLLQWKGILWAKKKGAQYYDFLGISPENALEHRLQTVSNFKEKFGGQRVQYEGGIDFMME